MGRHLAGSQETSLHSWLCPDQLGDLRQVPSLPCGPAQPPALCQVTASSSRHVCLCPCSAWPRGAGALLCLLRCSLEYQEEEGFVGEASSVLGCLRHHSIGWRGRMLPACRATPFLTRTRRQVILLAQSLPSPSTPLPLYNPGGPAASPGEGQDSISPSLSPRQLR